MDPRLFRLLTLLTGLAALTAAILITYSWARSHRAAFDDFRRAAYLATLGDIATRAGYPSQLVRGWARDRVFRAALVEFLTFLTGAERDNLLKAAHELEIVEHYRRQLRTGRRRRTRVAAAEALGDLGDSAAIPELLDSIADRIPEVRVQSAHALAAIADPLTVAPLLDALIAEEERWVAERLADALRRFDKAAVVETSLRLEELGHQLEPPSWTVLGVRVLGAIGDIHAERALLHCLLSPSRLLRESAATSLGRAGSPRAVRPLIGACHDPAPRVRVAAITSLGLHLDPAALETAEEMLHDADRDVRRAAGQALTKIPGGEDTLVEALRLGSDAARAAAADAVLEAGLYRSAVVRIKTNQATRRDEVLVEALAASGRLADIPNDPYQRLAS